VIAVQSLEHPAELGPQDPLEWGLGELHDRDIDTPAAE
jgi:hypothetical protein